MLIGFTVLNVIIPICLCIGIHEALHYVLVRIVFGDRTARLVSLNGRVGVRAELHGMKRAIAALTPYAIQLSSAMALAFLVFMFDYPLNFLLFVTTVEVLIFTFGNYFHPRHKADRTEVQIGISEHQATKLYNEVFQRVE